VQVPQPSLNRTHPVLFLRVTCQISSVSRVTLRRSYGDFVEVQVHAESCDVRGNKQTSNVGYFCIGGVDDTKTKLKFAQVIPSTVEQTERFTASLGRLLIAAVKLEGLQNTQASLWDVIACVCL